MITLDDVPIKVRKIPNKLLGRGATGAVYLALQEEIGRLVAVKEIPYHRGEGYDVIGKEMAMVRRAVHPNVVQYFGAEYDEGESLFRIFMEYVPGARWPT